VLENESSEIFSQLLRYQPGNSVQHLLAVLGCLSQLQSPIEHEETEKSEGDVDDEGHKVLRSLKVRHHDGALKSERELAEAAEDLVPVDRPRVPAVFRRDDCGAAQCEE